MKPVNLTEENIEEYVQFLGEDMAENIGRKFIKGLALDDVEEERTKAALIWGLKNSENPEVDTESELIFMRFEDVEAGGEIIEHYKEMAKQEKVARSFCELSASESESALLLMEHGFDVKEAESRLLDARLDDFTGLDLNQKKPASFIKPIKDLEIKRFRSAMEEIRLFKQRVGVEDVDYLPMDWFEQNISCCAVLDGRIRGFLLVHKKPSGILVPHLWYAEGSEAQKLFLNMLRFAVAKAAETYPPDTKVLIRRTRNDLIVLTQLLFEDFRGKNVFSAVYPG